jgi:hypothetical protein
VVERRKLRLIAVNGDGPEGTVQVPGGVEHEGCKGEAVGTCVDILGRDNNMDVVGPNLGRFGPSECPQEATIAEQ